MFQTNMGLFFLNILNNLDIRKPISYKKQWICCLALLYLIVVSLQLILRNLYEVTYMYVKKYFKKNKDNFFLI